MYAARRLAVHFRSSRLPPGKLTARAAPCQGTCAVACKLRKVYPFFHNQETTHAAIFLRTGTARGPLALAPFAGATAALAYGDGAPGRGHQHFCPSSVRNGVIQPVQQRREGPRRRCAPAQLGLATRTARAATGRRPDPAALRPTWQVRRRMLATPTPPRPSATRRWTTTTPARRRGRIARRAGYMPPFEGTLTQEAIWSIRTYLEDRANPEVT